MKQRIALNETWENAEAHSALRPMAIKLLLTASRRDSQRTTTKPKCSSLICKTQTWNSIYAPDYDAKPYFNPRAWTGGDWLVLTNADDDSTWVMRPNGESLTQSHAAGMGWHS
jgi:hypothetical protein